MSQTEPIKLAESQIDLKRREEVFAAQAQRLRERAIKSRSEGYDQVAESFENAAHRTEMKILELRAQRFHLKQSTDLRLVTVNGQRV